MGLPWAPLILCSLGPLLVQVTEIDIGPLCVHQALDVLLGARLGYDLGGVGVVPLSRAYGRGLLLVRRRGRGGDPPDPAEDRAEPDQPGGGGGGGKEHQGPVS